MYIYIIAIATKSKRHVIELSGPNDYTVITRHSGYGFGSSDDAFVWVGGYISYE